MVGDPACNARGRSVRTHIGVCRDGAADVCPHSDPTEPRSLAMVAERHAESTHRIFTRSASP